MGDWAELYEPALGARAFLVLSFAGPMTKFVADGADAVTSATPLTALKANQSVDLLEMFIGNHGGTIGETSTALF